MKYAEKGSGYSHIVGYNYDSGGNLTGKTKYAYTTAESPSDALDTAGYSYYTGTWKDLLTGYDGLTIESDTIGNPTEVKQGSTVLRSYEWEHGRQLKSVSGQSIRGTDGMLRTPSTSGNKNGLHVDSDGETRYYENNVAAYAGLIFWDGYYYYINSSLKAVKSVDYYVTTNNGLLPSDIYTFDANGRMVDPPDAYFSVDYTYNSAGLRTGKTVKTGATATSLTNTQEYTYVYNGSQLTYMTVDGHTLWFSYDAQGPMFVKYDSSTYQYLTNLQGDVIALANSEGDIVVEYTYDAWGNILSVTGTMAATLGKYNPLRYRGYVYDIETQLYYLQSRYYDPAMGRFINADGYTSTGQGILGNNMFAYCGNNPVLYADPSGAFFVSSVVSEIKECLRKAVHIAITGIELAQMGFADLSFESIRSCAETLNKYDIDTVEEKAHFFAQCAYETNRGMWLTELGDANYFADKPYGMKYRGAGYIQLTWDYNYADFAEAMGDPEILNQGAEYVAEYYAWEAAGWFWGTSNMNEKIANGWTVADVTRKVKGSYQGWWYRQQYYDEFLKILS